jgi:hypothetical protein
MAEINYYAYRVGFIYNLDNWVKQNELKTLTANDLEVGKKYMRFNRAQSVILGIYEGNTDVANGTVYLKSPYDNTEMSSPINANFIEGELFDKYFNPDFNPDESASAGGKKPYRRKSKKSKKSRKSRRRRSKK